MHIVKHFAVRAHLLLSRTWLEFMAGADIGDMSQWQAMPQV